MIELHGRPKRAPRVAQTLLAATFVMAGAPALAQTDTEKGIEAYREMIQEGNPAELLVLKGEDLWKTARGPKNASLEKCDLGLGPGVVKGAYAKMPRYFKDTDQVMDFESRLVHCMVELQGFERQKLVAKPFTGSSGGGTDIESITAYATEESRGTPVDIPQQHPKEQASYKRGEKIFFYAGGPYDFSCATCHSRDEQRIRLQSLPNLTEAKDARRAFTSWPAYRVSQGAFRTMQWRLEDCFRQQRFPALKYLSPASIDLITYLGVKAKGEPMAAPGIKR